MKNDAVNLSKNEMLMVMHDQEKEISELKAEVESLREQLKNYDIKIEKIGSLAGAAAQINDLFTAAQATADMFSVNVKMRSERAEKALIEAETKARQIVDEAERTARKMLNEADIEVEAKWRVIELRLEEMYASRQGLQQLVESGILGNVGTPVKKKPKPEKKPGSDW